MMKSYFTNLLVIVAALVVVFSGCGDKPQQSSGPQLTNRVFAASYALQFLTQQIAGSEITVEFPVPNDVDPKIWSPKVADIQNIQSADLVVLNGTGAEYADWFQRVSLVQSRVCESAMNLTPDDYIVVGDYQVVHSHGPEGEHTHEYKVPYPWLDPAMAKLQAKSIADALSTRYADRADTFQANLKTLNDELDQLIAEFETQKKTSTATSISLNPQTKFFTRAVGLDDSHVLIFDLDEPVQVENETEKLKGLLAKKANALILECSSTPVTFSSVYEQAELSLENRKVIVIDLLDHPPESGDYFSAMRANLKAIQ